MRVRPALVAAAVSVAALTAGCSGGDASTPNPVPATSTSTPTDDSTAATASLGTADPTTAVPAGFNPCHRLRLAPIARALGSSLTRQLGDATNPRCGLLPADPDGPVLTVTYQPSTEPLDDILRDLGEDPDTARHVAVPRGAVARILVTFDDPTATPTVTATPSTTAAVAGDGRAAFVTGFVQVGALVEVVNAADPPPYQGSHLARATEVVLRQLAATAPR